MIGTVSRGPGIVISGGGSFSESMSSDLFSEESAATIRENIPVDFGSLIAL
jgi:hypothetical protein